MREDSLSHGLKKREILRSPKLISHLFEHGASLFVFPLKLIYTFNPNEKIGGQVQASFSVPKRNHKKAVTRNLLKRRMRESYRRHKPSMTDAHHDLLVMYILVDKSVTSYEQMNSSMIQVNNKLIASIDRG